MNNAAKPAIICRIDTLSGNRGLSRDDIQAASLKEARELADKFADPSVRKYAYPMILRGRRYMAPNDGVDDSARNRSK